MNTILPLVGRILMSLIFIIGGFNKMMAAGATAANFAARGLPMPSVTVWIVVAIELLGGIALLVGYKTRVTGAILGIWCLVTGLVIHLATAINTTDAAVHATNMVHTWKNICMAGGFAYVVAYGAGALSIDNRRR